MQKVSCSLIERVNYCHYKRGEDRFDGENVDYGGLKKDHKFYPSTFCFSID